jgi:hypothetical protein
MPKVTLRRAILADLPHVISGPLPCRIRAITALIDDRVIGLGGLALPDTGPAIAFVQLAPASGNDAASPGSDGVAEAKRYPVSFHRAGLLAMQMIRDSTAAQVIATADAGSDVAVRWLKRLGFKPADEQEIDGKLLFVWNRDSRDQAAGAAARPSSIAGRDVSTSVR